MEKVTPTDLIPIKNAGEKTDKGHFFFLVAAAQEKIEIFRPGSDGYHICPVNRIKEYLDNDPNDRVSQYRPYVQSLYWWQSKIESLDHLYISELDATILAQKNNNNSLSAIEKLEILNVDFLKNRQQEDGFKIWKKNIADKFKIGVRAAVAVITYCHQQNKQLKKAELENLLQHPEKHPGATALVKYKGKIPMDLIQDIYTELPPEFRHQRGESAK